MISSGTSAHNAVGIDMGDVLLWDMIRGPLFAVSRTTDRLGHIDFAMALPPARAFAWLTLCPFVAYPLAALYSYGALRALRTTRSPVAMRGSDRYDTATKQFVVQKRVFDKRQRRMVETQLTDDVQQIQHALALAGDQRNTFVDDPKQPGVAYYVQERLIMRNETLFTGENWTWAITSDVMRYWMPIGLCFIFHPAAQRLRVDLQLLVRGRLRWRQLRHPIINFFRTAQDYQRAKIRQNTTNPLPSGARPWHYKL